MNRFKAYMRRQQFHPGLLGIFVNPFYMVRKELRKAMVALSPDIHGKTLGIGCGERPYEELFPGATEYTGMEYGSPENRLKFKNIDAWYDGKIYPFSTASFDSVILTQVLEHIFNPDEFLAELSRVTKEGGKLLLSVPFVWDEHSQPYDYARYSSFGLEALLAKHGFKIEKHIKTAPDVRVIFQLINCYLHKKLNWISNYKARIILYTILVSPSTILGLTLSKILPKNLDLYMDNVVLARKI